MKHTFIIVEGCDSTGKSWLAKELSKALYLPVINRLSPKPTIFEECISTLWLSQPFIIDRFYLSELVYGKVMRGNVRLTSQEVEEIETKCNSINTLNIYCYDTVEAITNRFENNFEKQYPKVKDVAPIITEFNKELVKSGLIWHGYKVGDSVEDLIKLYNE